MKRRIFLGLVACALVGSILGVGYFQYLERTKLTEWLTLPKEYKIVYQHHNSDPESDWPNKWLPEEFYIIQSSDSVGQTLQNLSGCLVFDPEYITDIQQEESTETARRLRVYNMYLPREALSQYPRNSVKFIEVEGSGIRVNISAWTDKTVKRTMVQIDSKRRMGP